MDIALWIARSLLALAFLLTGLTKVFTPMERLKGYMAWVMATPAALVRWIGIAECVGAIGLILPALDYRSPLADQRRGNRTGCGDDQRRSLSCCTQGIRRDSPDDRAPAPGAFRGYRPSRLGAASLAGPAQKSLYH